MLHLLAWMFSYCIDVLLLLGKLTSLFGAVQALLMSGLLCSIVSAVNLEKDLQDHDSMFLVQVTEADTDHPAAAAGSDSLPEDASLRSVLAAFKDCFPAELPAQLPPERNVYHTIPCGHD